MAEYSDTYSEGRFSQLSEYKTEGAVYTPPLLADFVADQIVSTFEPKRGVSPLRIIDPAIGHGELVVSLLRALKPDAHANINVYGFDTNPSALDKTKERLLREFPGVSTTLEFGNFLDFVVECSERGTSGSLYPTMQLPLTFDLVIANPPYVRTQILGAKQAQHLSNLFGLSGRVDLYHAFILGIRQVLEPRGVAGVIVSNRFMSTKAGNSVRKAIIEGFNVRHAWDLGDTKLFDAAVLPAVLLLDGKRNSIRQETEFTSIYETVMPPTTSASDPISALAGEGVTKIADGRTFHVQHGKLDTNGSSDGMWRVANESTDTWLSEVASRRGGCFGDIGKIRVGVKSCADRVFIRDDWNEMPDKERPELLRPLTTHHVARRYKARRLENQTQILYPHEIVNESRRAVDLAKFPRTGAYLTRYKSLLEKRTYVLDAGRNWYEIWVPQDPNAWQNPKIVFRDISAKPTFWIDLDGTVVNGDCYWLSAKNEEDTDLLWLAVAVANSTFIEHYYDLCFHNKLYSGRRRFMTQYVEQFPIPDRQLETTKQIIAKSKQIHQLVPSSASDRLQDEVNSLIWLALTGRSRNSQN